MTAIDAPMFGHVRRLHRVCRPSARLRFSLGTDPQPLGTGLTGDERLAAAFIVFGHVRNTLSMTTTGTQAWSGNSELAERIRGRADLFPELNQALTGQSSISVALPN